MKKIISVCVLGLLSGCASMGGYTPVVDSYGDKHAAYISQDMAQCQALAKQNSSVGTELLTQGGVGALIGAGGGAALGAVFGNPAIGAAAGATVGGIGGATKGGLESDDRYKRIYRNCMRNRGHRVLD